MYFYVDWKFRSHRVRSVARIMRIDYIENRSVVIDARINAHRFP